MKAKKNIFGIKTRQEKCPECKSDLAWKLMVPKNIKSNSGNSSTTVYRCPECGTLLSELLKLEFDQPSTKISLIGGIILLLSFLLKTESDNFRFGVLVVGTVIMLVGLLIEVVRTRGKKPPLNRWKKADDI